MTFSLREVVDQTSDATLKGRVLAALAAQSQGFDDSALLDLTGVIVDLETFFLGNCQFQLQDISTAETATGSAAATDTNVITLNVAPDRDFRVGEVFKIDTEFCKVTSHVAGSLSVFVERGYAGSTAAVQSADAIERSSATAVADDNYYKNYLIVPTVDLTQADAAAKIILAVPAIRPEFGAVATGTNDVTFTAAYSDSHVDNAEAMGNATLANFAGGTDSFQAAQRCTYLHGPVGSETSFVVYVPSHLTPVGVYIAQIDDSADAVITDNTYVIAGQRVTVTEGATAWEDSADYVYVEVYCVLA
jgi:hypothetical protein